MDKSLENMPRKEYIAPEPKCWVYDLGEGWIAMAGKTDEDNDLLSIRVAKQNECWFHINGMPGSHVILRGPEGEVPTQERIEATAAIAAWHSKARGGGRCSVDMTLAKYVSKPAGAKPGLVCISHEKKIKVIPAIPQNTQNTQKN